MKDIKDMSCKDLELSMDISLRIANAARERLAELEMAMEHAEFLGDGNYMEYNKAKEAEVREELRDAEEWYSACGNELELRINGSNGVDDNLELNYLGRA